MLTYLCDWCEEPMVGHNPEAFEGSLKAKRHTICILASERQQATPIELLAAVEVEKSAHAVNAFWHAYRARMKREAACRG